MGSTSMRDIRKKVERNEIDKDKIHDQLDRDRENEMHRYKPDTYK